MSEEQIILNCSPTLAGIKTGNLFRCRCDDRGDFINSTRNLNKRLVPKGVKVIPICVSDACALVYVYREARLREDLMNDEAMKLLRKYGYVDCNINKCVSRLCKRLSTGCSKEYFPHEVGLFLGYPPMDVRGFIESPSKGYKMVGFWKVYGDEMSASKKFDLYRRCERIYKKQWHDGSSLERLTVADIYKN